MRSIFLGGLAVLVLVFIGAVIMRFAIEKKMRNKFSGMQLENYSVAIREVKLEGFSALALREVRLYKGTDTVARLGEVLATVDARSMLSNQLLVHSLVLRHLRVEWDEDKRNLMKTDPAIKPFVPPASIAPLPAPEIKEERKKEQAEHDSGKEVSTPQDNSALSPGPFKELPHGYLSIIKNKVLKIFPVAPDSIIITDASLKYHSQSFWLQMKSERIELLLE